MKFVRIIAKGNLNSFRRSDFQTYHKTFPLPLKTTVGGMLGSAMGKSPDEINNEWLQPGRFQMGIVGKSNGETKDLWQIRKYESKQIKAFNEGKADSPYKTAVIVRELLYAIEFIIYMTFPDDNDLCLVVDKLKNPKWALSLGREDELIRIETIDIIELNQDVDLVYSNTVLPIDLSVAKYEIDIDGAKLNSMNLLNEAPQIVKVPILFSYDMESHERVAVEYSTFSFIGSVPIKIDGYGFYDPKLHRSFQIF